MSSTDTVETHLTRQGVSRRAFLKYCSVLSSVLALPASAVPLLSEKLRHATRPSVIWLSFQECTGCTESMTRSYAPTIEELLFNFISLDYHHTLQAASGQAAESARSDAIRQQFGRYLLIVDGSIPIGDAGVYSTIAGTTNLALLQECSKGAAAVIAIGTCAAFGGLPAAAPNPTGAASVSELMQRGMIEKRSLVNLPGCPPLPVAITGVLAHYLAFGRFPALDPLQRPLSMYGNTVHERCSRYHYYQQEKFALHFDDEGARKGWCLYKLGCKGPVTHNACAVHKWNGGTSFPVEAGHPCIGCSEPGFWDRGGFYQNLEDTASLYPSANKPTDTTAAEGRELYENNCAYCHPVDPSGLKTEAEQIPNLLRSGEIRSHRRLELTDAQLDALKKYLHLQK